MNQIPKAEEILDLILLSKPDKPVGREVAIAYLKTYAQAHLSACIEAIREATFHGLDEDPSFSFDDCYPESKII